MSVTGEEDGPPAEALALDPGPGGSGDDAQQSRGAAA